ncbi:hypothetical protein [Enterococcus cecorum]|uniref:hypothetical protein n=1 Tax=Enterococcus cecorum TaxID=44008 RepID=UPI0013A6020E|nr:hypothetical protein [Enterococcus cecorum]
MQEVRKIFEKGIDKYVLRVYNATSNDNITFVTELKRDTHSVGYTGAICVATESVVA